MRLLVNLMMKLTLKHGICKISGIAFALYGMSMPDGDIREGYRFGKLALELQKRIDAREWDPRVFTFVYTLCHHWQQPLHLSLDPLLTAHRSGMTCGDIDFAFQAAGAYQTLYFYCGMALEPAVKDMRNFCSEMVAYNQEKALVIYLPLWQCMLNLRGESHDPLVLTGEAMNQEEYSKNKSFTTSELASYRMQIAYYLNALSLAHELAEELQTQPTEFNTHFMHCVRTFFLALVWIGVARRDKQRKPRKKAKRILKLMQGWVKRGAVNCVHKLLLVQAEYQSIVSSSTEKVRKAYRKAVTTAGRSGFIQDEALASERAGLYCFDSGDHYRAKDYISRAYALYRDWGALAKVVQLEKTHKWLLDTSDDATVKSTGLRARERFDRSIGMQHRSLESRRFQRNSGIGFDVDAESLLLDLDDLSESAATEMVSTHYPNSQLLVTSIAPDETNSHVVKSLAGDGSSQMKDGSGCAPEGEEEGDLEVLEIF
eukprot:CAMPEP_0116845946 /NCGR_PEP_ID=MMETSP0418-20121206/13566_1 /TAXON_ID=1158023 /ORGANISM="Astrosyne radiata, Strain 13vi08-1A" /LENGTH=484 /DNA_ID=CAMNT_0004477147 /DNA_START=135 /DNA_END=1589 /DNA_ORIENTATION=-